MHICIDIPTNTHLSDKLNLENCGWVELVGEGERERGRGRQPSYQPTQLICHITRRNSTTQVCPSFLDTHVSLAPRYLGT